MTDSQPIATDFDPTQVNPIYEQLSDSWRLNRDFAEMPLHLLRSGEYLDRFGSAGSSGGATEVSSQYAWRRNAAVAIDHCADLINLRVDNIFRTPPVRSYDDSPYKNFLDEFLADVDGGGTAMDAFMYRALHMHYINGVDFVVDKQSPPDVASPATLAQERELGLLPQVHVFSALERIDWALDGPGGYKWARYSMGRAWPDDETQDRPDISRYLSVTRNQWRLYEVGDDNQAGATVRTGPISLGVCPIVPFYFKESTRGDYPKVPLSLLTRIAPIARYLLNLMSQIQIDIYRNIAFLVATGVSADQIPAEITPMGCWTLPEGAELKDVAGDVAHIQVKLAFARTLTEAILRIGKLTGSTGDLKSRAASGVQVAVERTDLDNEMRASACQCQDVERQIVRLAVSRYEGRLVGYDEIGYSVEYNKNFVLTPVTDLVERARQFVSMGLHGQVPTLLKIQLRKILNALSKQDDTAYRKAIDEIESAVFTAGNRQ